MNSVKKLINPLDRKYCFQLFGYDFIMDSGCKLYLIEVNNNPCLEETNSFLKCLI